MEGYILKQTPEDFVVREIFQPKLSPAGPYSYYKLSKRGLTTQLALGEVSRSFRIQPKFINCSGNKDKHAITEQIISVRNGPECVLERPGLRVEFLGRGKERINLGSAPSNHFIITIRNLQKKPKAIKQFVNCYDSQRFGSAGNNHEIGRLLLKREFAKAAKMVPELSGEKDAVKALLQLPKGVLRIYPHAYQSWLWNKMAGDYFKSHPKTKNLKVPIIGWNTVLRPPFREVGRKLLASEGLRRHDFKIAELPECNLEGDERDLFAIPKNLKIGPLQRDELNSGRRKVTVEFSLGAGSYATMCVRVMMSSKAP